MLQPASEIMQELLTMLQSTGAPALMHKDLPGLCTSLLEVLDQGKQFKGCSTHGETHAICETQHNLHVLHPMCGNTPLK